MCRSIPSVERKNVRSCGSVPSSALAMQELTQPHSGCKQQLDIGMLFEHFHHVLRANRLVHVAVAGIGDDVASPRLPRHHFDARNLSGRKRIGRSAGIARTTFAAFAEVQQ